MGDNMSLGPVKICSVAQNPSDQIAIESALETIGRDSFAIVGSTKEAELVIFTVKSELDNCRYDPDKFYAFIRKTEEEPQLPKNCTVVDLFNLATELYAVVKNIHGYDLGEGSENSKISGFRSSFLFG
jgi:hypothetical protein